MGAPPLWNFESPLLLDVTLHRKLSFTFLLCFSCPFLDRRPNIGKNISLRAFRQVLLKNEVHFQLHNYDLFEKSCWNYEPFCIPSYYKCTFSFNVGLLPPQVVNFPLPPFLRTFMRNSEDSGGFLPSS